MATNLLLALIVLFCVVAWMGQSFHVNGYNVLTPTAKKWWMDSASALEPFMNLDGSMKVDEKGTGAGTGTGTGTEEDVSDNSPGKPAPVDLLHMEPYHLLSDVLGKTRDSLSSVTSRSCYATDAEAYLSRVGNFRQLTNNYTRQYPDHCSSARHELVLNFYEAKPIMVSGSGFGSGFGAGFGGDS